MVHVCSNRRYGHDLQIYKSKDQGTPLRFFFTNIVLSIRCHALLSFIFRAATMHYRNFSRTTEVVCFCDNFFYFFICSFLLYFKCVFFCVCVCLCVCVFFFICLFFYFRFFVLFSFLFLFFCVLCFLFFFNLFLIYF